MADTIDVHDLTDEQVEALEALAESSAGAVRRNRRRLWKRKQ